MNMNEISDFLKSLRKSKGLTQSELAEILNVSNKTVSKWETGLGIPETQTLIVLADLYQVTVDDILRGSKKVSKDERKVEINKEYLYKKAKNKFVNIFFIVLGVNLVNIILFFIIKSLTSNKTIVTLIPLLIVIISIIIMVINNNHFKNNIVGINDKLNEYYKEQFKFNFYNYFLIIYTVIFIVSCNIGIITNENSFYVYKLISSFVNTAAIVLVLVLIIDSINPNIYFNKLDISKKIISYITTLLIIIFTTTINTVGFNKTHIYLDGKYVATSIGYVDTEAYYRLKFLKEVKEYIASGRRPEKVLYRIGYKNGIIGVLYKDGNNQEIYIDDLMFQRYLESYAYGFSVTDEYISAKWLSASNDEIRLNTYVMCLTAIIFVDIVFGSLIIILFKKREQI